MRRTVITAAVLVTIIIVLRAASVMTADAPREAVAAVQWHSINVMQLMRDAKGLPEERCDAV